MPIDKFGRSQFALSGNKAKLFRGPKGEGFNLTTDGNFDINQKRLCNVASPTELNDVITLQYLNNSVSKLFLDIDKKINSGLKNVLKLLEAIDINKHYVSLRNKRRIVSVNSAKDENDVIIKKDLDSEVIKLNTEINNIKINVLDLKHQHEQYIKQANTEVSDIKINVLDLKHQFNQFAAQVNLETNNRYKEYTEQINSEISLIKVYNMDVRRQLKDINQALISLTDSIVNLATPATTQR